MLGTHAGDEEAFMLNAKAFKNNEQVAWDLCADRYDRCLTVPFTPFSRKLVRLASLEKGHQVLDVATGSGLAALMAAKSVGPEGRVTGVDLSGTMIELARQRASVEGTPNVEFLQMDAEKLEFADECFDAVLCALGLMLFPQPGRALAEMHRVVRKGGRVALSVFGRGSRVALRAFIEPFIPHMPPPPQRGPSTFGFGRTEALEEALDEAGFSEISTEQESHMLNFEGAEKVWEMVLSLGRLARMHSRLPQEKREELRQQVLQIAEEKYRESGGALELPFEITYAVAQKGAY
jgi:ubiquinone/menaquinone biosynthesis C-methylase UbiE